MSKLGERLEILMKECGIKNRSALAKFAGVSSALVTQWFDGSTGLGSKPLIAFDKTHFSTQWLISGMGNKYKTEKTNTYAHQSDYITFSVLDISASMGVGIINIDYLEIIDTVTVAKKWAREKLGNNLSSIRVITARGDSMAETIQDGSVLFVDESITFYNGEGIYIIYTPDGLKAKRLQLTVSGVLNIISDNPKYPIETISKNEVEDIRICGKVKGVWQLEQI